MIWDGRLHIVYTILSVILMLSHGVCGSDSNMDPESLDAVFQEYTMKELVHHRTGILFDVHLPSNFTGMNISAVRVRSGNLREKGAKFSYFYFPPGVVAFPYVKRLAIVYQNLGNLSTSYYHVPGYSFVSPVVGFSAYDASNSLLLGNETLRLSAMGEPILVNLTRTTTTDGYKGEPKCVKFVEGGLVQFRNITKEMFCFTEGDGHFAVVVPLPERKGDKGWIRWVVGCVAGAVGLLLLGLILVTSLKLVRSKIMKDMEGASERGVPLVMTWIGRSKMPSASMTRTQPSLDKIQIKQLTHQMSIFFKIW
ncbi:hypothetical protein K2173_003480 [Erythroxylum novogranatense]|uniref:Uncharacterized protein n=1 Tax=Erythroxylum novogranatense TaxID=1862640 RepID=A0AAV8S914_9ROSI|nr:hypothetical protein K2173_003480 [Erythroxylum novogranatense]